MSLKRVGSITSDKSLYFNGESGDWEIRKLKNIGTQYQDSNNSYDVIYANGSFKAGFDSSTLTDTQINVAETKLKGLLPHNYKVSPKNIETSTPQTNVLETEADGTMTMTVIGEREDDSNWWEPNTTDIQFGLADDILKSFGLMKYPIDAQYANSQDHIKITQRKYNPPKRDIFSGDSNPWETLKNGIERGNPAGEIINIVKLPMPNNLADSNGVSWGADSMNALTAAAAGAVTNTVNTESIGNLLNALKTPLNTLGDAGNAVKGAIKNREKIISDITTQLTNASNNPNMNTAANAMLGSAALNMLNFNVSAESILARGKGIIPNSNLELLLRAPTLRKFGFAWKLSPRSRDEATIVNQIVRSFKQGMAVKKQNNVSGSASYFLGTPNIFDVQFQSSYGEEIDGVMRIKTCACTSAAVSYAPDGQWSAYEEGQPTSITLNLSFEELEPLYDTDYNDFIPTTSGLRPVSNSSVGY
tara:strand:- start:1688 stop:3109 length:1422 start_codon:yes stop_codon:yes gene_type:complete